MQHPLLIKWEKQLKKLLDEVDEALEKSYGANWPLHPARPAQGSTANKAHDGLFDITANFSLGLGSDRGRGYTIDIHMATLNHITPEEKQAIEEQALKLIAERLKTFFPGRALAVDRDGHLIRLYGDLSLGHVH